MSNVETAYSFFVNSGFTPAQASGIVGNLMQESGVNPESVQPNGPGRGIAQWSLGGRWLPSLMTGNVTQDLQNQEQYILDELQANPAYGLSALKQATTPDQAANIFGNDYEKYGIKGARVTDAEQIYSQAQQGNWPSATGSQPASTTFALTGQPGVLPPPPSPGSNPSTPEGGVGGNGFGAGFFNDVGGVFGGVLGNIIPGFSSFGAVLSDIGAIATEGAAALGLATQQQPQNLAGSGFLSSVDELLNPSINLFAPWNAITMFMGRSALALLGVSILISGVALILFGTEHGRKFVQDAAMAIKGTAEVAAV